VRIRLSLRSQYRLARQPGVVSFILKSAMQQIVRLVRGFSSPATLIIVVWCAALLGVAIGPIDYPGQPTSAVLALVAAGVSLFVLAHWAGLWCFDVWSQRQRDIPVASPRILNGVVIATSLAGLVGIALMAFDRQALSGVANGGYAELLRCAPTLVDLIEIKRTPLLYTGYLTFSFGFASLVLFLLKGEEIGGWAALLAQFSILSPIGYALLYSGRMPILFLIVLIVAAMLVRIGQGRRPLPSGYHLPVKLVLVVLVFAIYSSAIWSRRQSFCIRMSGLIHELQQRQAERNFKQAELGKASKIQGGAVGGPAQPQRRADAITASDLTKRVDETSASSNVGSQSNSTDDFSATMMEAWNVKPRPYFVSATNSGYLSSSTGRTVLSTYFYLTHGMRTIDTVWHARGSFSPQWGLYEVGILSPIFRVFFPQYDVIANMESQLKSAGIFGFFPTVWVAAFIDFGTPGAIIYIFGWGFAAGCSASGARRSALVTPQLLLCFILASIFLSPVQGPLGIANSLLVLASLLATGAAIDLSSARKVSPTEVRKSKLGALG
jgi:hypothetical protein